MSGSHNELIEGDITRIHLADEAYDLWHDRAVCHFLTDAADRLAVN